MSFKSRPTDGHERTTRGFSESGLTSEVREVLTRFALASEQSIDTGEALDRIEQRLATQEISSPELDEAARILRSNIARWRTAHTQLARLTTDLALLYEDEACSMGE